MRKIDGITIFGTLRFYIDNWDLRRTISLTVMFTVIDSCCSYSIKMLLFFSLSDEQCYRVSGVFGIKKCMKIILCFSHTIYQAHKLTVCL